MRPSEHIQSIVTLCIHVGFTPMVNIGILHSNTQFTKFYHPFDI